MFLSYWIAQISQTSKIKNKKGKKMSKNPVEKRYYRPIEAAIYLGVGESTIWDWVRKGKLKVKKIGPKVTVVDKFELDKL